MHKEPLIEIATDRYLIDFGPTVIVLAAQKCFGAVVAKLRPSVTEETDDVTVTNNVTATIGYQILIDARDWEIKPVPPNTTDDMWICSLVTAQSANAKDPKDQSALLLACEAGFTEVVGALIARGAVIYAQDSDDRAPLKNSYPNCTVMHDAQLHVGANVYVTERFARNRIAPVQDINSKKAAIFRLLLEQNVAMLTTSEKKDLVQTAQQEGMPEVLAVLREFFPGIPEGAGAVHLDMPAYSYGAQFAYGQIGNVEIPIM
ncbi:hypothetical protein H2198_003119 [Neophaeococcomyces mojaviensis]|uniref:Uncharacterized protein n=1 Tax=Neophaeococcomyces mojaviensis TaxID=3383035 RepID=A0ACC3AC31_9EURO|nr:hypothetical protein H2198_003119 [Knufia sp. JES_112]